MLQAIVVYIHERKQEHAEPEQRSNIVSSVYRIVSSPNAEYKRYVIRQEDTPSYFFCWTGPVMLNSCSNYGASNTWLRYSVN
jgi:hypothetical protein